ncbi:MAG: NAD(P)-dependent alcohol dehydrogenase [Thermoleophilia bacterium]|nr:NAD(P)-dependent alcohol dehydrogenase [Thermoleophilia bacterium]
MQAYQLVEWQQPPELRDVPVPEPGPGQVLIKVGGACACHTDLRVMDWPAGLHPYELPFTLGHENAGWVEVLGAGVDGWRPGDAVVVYGPWGCGRCAACRQGREMQCERNALIDTPIGGFGLDGGMAEYMLVPSARFLAPLHELDPRDAAPLADAALTPYHAISSSSGLLRPGTWALVIGVGGLGHMAVQLLRAVTPAQVVAIDVDGSKLELARELGADETVPAGESAAGQVRELTGGLGATVVFDCVGSDETLKLAADVARDGGAVQVIGLAGGTLPFGYGALPFGCSLTIPYWGSVTELMEVLELARSGAVRAHTERFSLENAAEAYARLRAGDLLGRAVVTPQG